MMTTVVSIRNRRGLEVEMSGIDRFADRIDENRKLFLLYPLQ